MFFSTAEATQMWYRTVAFFVIAGSLCATLELANRAHGDETEDADDICASLFAKKSPRALIGRVVDNDFRFTYMADVTTDQETTVFTHVIKNEQRSRALPAGWPEGGLKYVKDCGDCRMNQWSTATLAAAERRGHIVFGTKKERLQKATAYGNSESNRKDADGESDDNEQLTVAPANATGKLMRSRILLVGDVNEERTRRLHVDVEFECRREGATIVYGIMPRATERVYFSIPELAQAWGEALLVGATPRVPQTWRRGDSDSSMVFMAVPKEFNTMTVVLAEDTPLVERQVTMYIVSAQGALEGEEGGERPRTVLASGFVSVYLPK